MIVAHTHPRRAISVSRISPCTSFSPIIQAPPCTWSSTGASAFAGRSARRQMSRRFRFAELGVGDVAGCPVSAALTEPGQRLLGDRQSGLATDRFGHLVAVARAERGGERLVQHRRCSLGVDRETRQSRPRGQLDRQRDPARPGRQRTGGRGDRGARRLAGERQQRCLARRPTRSERSDAGTSPPARGGGTRSPSRAAPTALAANNQRSVLTDPSSRPDDEPGR